MEILPEQVEIGDAVVYQALQDEVVLLNMSTQQYYGLNDVGARMWELLLGTRRVSEVAEQLEATYEVDGGTVRADLGRLVHELLRAGLLKAA